MNEWAMTFLHDLIADQAEGAVLGEFGDLTIERVVFEMELEVVGDDVFFRFCDLLESAVRDGLALEIAQDQEAESYAFDVMDGNGIGDGGFGRNKFVK